MKNKNKNKENRVAKLKIFLMSASLLGCMGYLCVINMGAVKGYEIRKAEKEIAELKKENKRLQIEEAELSSFYNIKKDVNGLDMVEATEIVYANDNEHIVAFKK